MEPSLGVATTTAVIATTALATTTVLVPDWWTAKDGIEIVAVVLLGMLTTIAREAYYAFDSEEPHSSSFFQTMAMLPVGVVGALLGQDIAQLGGMPELDWSLAISIAWIGGEALDRISAAIMGIVDKMLTAIGVRADAASKAQLDQDKARYKRLQEALDDPL